MEVWGANAAHRHLCNRVKLWEMVDENIMIFHTGSLRKSEVESQELGLALY